jgi:hypothetical protein
LKVIKTIEGNELLLDDEDYEKASKYKWSTYKTSSGSPTINTTINRRPCLFTSLILRRPKGFMTYFKNGDPYDLRKENIIFLDRRTYCYLIKQPKNKTSKYNGVHLLKGKNSDVWRVDEPDYSGKHQLYTFESEYEAAVVADYLATKNYGKYAKRNFPDIEYDKLIKMCNDIFDRYGNTVTDKKSKSTQGKRKAFSNKTSKYVGVRLMKSRKSAPWVATINKNNKSYHLGLYATEEEAARVYDKKALELYGEDANLNFPIKK